MLGKSYDVSFGGLGNDYVCGVNGWMGWGACRLSMAGGCIQPEAAEWVRHAMMVPVLPLVSQIFLL